MAKKTTKQIILNCTISIEETPVVIVTSTIPSETGVGSMNQYVQNSELYDANKTVIRREVGEFQQEVYDEEDAMAASVKV